MIIRDVVPPGKVMAEALQILRPEGQTGSPPSCLSCNGPAARRYSPATDTQTEKAMSNKLSGKVAVVTGASKGMGEREW